MCRNRIVTNINMDGQNRSLLNLLINLTRQIRFDVHSVKNRRKLVNIDASFRLLSLHQSCEIIIDIII